MEQYMVKRKTKGNSGKVGGPKAATAFKVELFATDLINHRAAAGLTQRQVAKELGFSPAGLTFIENCVCLPGVDIFAKLVRKFKLDPAVYL